MPFADLAAAKTIDAFYIAVAKSMNMELRTDLPMSEVPKILVQKIRELKASSECFVLYLDNFEETYYGVRNERTQEQLLLQWFEELRKESVTILISSRENPAHYNFTPIEALPLNQADSKNLFYQICPKNRVDVYEEDMETLLDKLDGHPLAIVLTAYQAVNVPTLKSIINNWKRISFASTTVRHESLATALRFSWDALTSDAAKDIWGLLSIATHELTFERLEKLNRNEYSIAEWDEGIAQLKKQA